MNKVSIFIDGFNFYHSLLKNSASAKCKWLDLKKLFETYLSDKEEIQQIYYFTAYCTWNKSKFSRQKTYFEALKSTGIE